MERLEAALEKAREKRQTTQSEQKVAILSNPIAPVVADVWQGLREFKLSPRIARNNRITTLTNNSLSSSYDMLRSRTARVMGENKWKRLAVTSPNVSCGKTTVVTNLAISLARQADLRVLVLDMDLRRPAVNKILNVKDQHSFHEVLEGKIEAADQIMRLGENLAFALNFKPAQHPSELLQSNRTIECLNQIEKQFEPDLILFDMPPLLGTDDNVGFLKNVDCGLLIGAAGETSVTQMDICEKELSELTNVLGVVLNKCRYMEAAGGYDYDYY